MLHPTEEFRQRCANQQD